MSESAVLAEIDHLLSLDLRGLKSEVENLRAIEVWARSSLGLDYGTGDRIEIVSPRPSQVGQGWACYAEALAVGQTGIAGEISFNRWATDGGEWYVLVGLDRSWSTHGRRILGDAPVVRYWNGPAAELPEGFKLPGGYPPEGKTKFFSMPVSWVRKASS